MRADLLFEAIRMAPKEPDNTTLAHHLGAYGVPVLPVNRHNKRPMVERGVYAASTEVETWPHWAAPAIPCGDGLTVLDVDNLANTPSMTSLTVQTPGRGGLHLICRGTSATSGSNRDPQIKGEGSYVLAPLARVASGRYTIGALLPPVDLPPEHHLEPWKRTVLRSVPSEWPSVPAGTDPKAAAVLDDASTAIMEAPEGQRNWTCLMQGKRVGHYVAARLIDGAIAEKTLQEAAAGLKMPLSESVETVTRGLKYGYEVATTWEVVAACNARITPFQTQNSHIYLEDAVTGKRTGAWPNWLRWPDAKRMEKQPAIPTGYGGSWWYSVYRRSIRQKH